MNTRRLIDWFWQICSALGLRIPDDSQRNYCQNLGQAVGVVELLNGLVSHKTHPTLGHFEIFLIPQVSPQIMFILRSGEWLSSIEIDGENGTLKIDGVNTTGLTGMHLVVNTQDELTTIMKLALPSAKQQTIGEKNTSLLSMLYLNIPSLRRALRKSNDPFAEELRFALEKHWKKPMDPYVLGRLCDYVRESESIDTFNFTYAARQICGHCIEDKSVLIALAIYLTNISLDWFDPSLPCSDAKTCQNWAQEAAYFVNPWGSLAKRALNLKEYRKFQASNPGIKSPRYYQDMVINLADLINQQPSSRRQGTGLCLLQSMKKN